ncbi:MAG: hypothetical protein ABIF19_04765 [Planctomycetota bacterium]
MNQNIGVIKVILVCVLATVLSSREYARAEKVVIDPSVKNVGRYEKLELLIQVDAQYDNPFDPNEVDLTVLLKTPGNEQITGARFLLPGLRTAEVESGPRQSPGLLAERQLVLSRRGWRMESKVRSIANGHVPRHSQAERSNRHNSIAKHPI